MAEISDVIKVLMLIGASSLAFASAVPAAEHVSCKNEIHVAAQSVVNYEGGWQIQEKFGDALGIQFGFKEHDARIEQHGSTIVLTLGSTPFHPAPLVSQSLHSKSTRSMGDRGLAEIQIDFDDSGTELTGTIEYQLDHPARQIAGSLNREDRISKRDAKAASALEIATKCIEQLEVKIAKLRAEITESDQRRTHDVRELENVIGGLKAEVAASRVTSIQNRLRLREAESNVNTLDDRARRVEKTIDRLRDALFENGNLLMNYGLNQDACPIFSLLKEMFPADAEFLVPRTGC